MEELVVELVAVTVPILGAILLKLLRDHLNVGERSQEIRDALTVARIVVDAADQIGRVYGIHGEEKMNHAIEYAKRISARYGLDLTDEQWQVIIESVVGEANRIEKELT